MSSTIVYDYKLEHHRVSGFAKAAAGIMMAIPSISITSIVASWIWMSCMVIGVLLAFSGIQLMVRYELAPILEVCPKSFTWLPESKRYRLLIQQLIVVIQREREEQQTHSNTPAQAAEAVFSASFDIPKAAEMLFGYFRLDATSGDEEEKQAESTATNLVIAFKAASA